LQVGHVDVPRWTGPHEGRGCSGRGALRRQSCADILKLASRLFPIAHQKGHERLVVDQPSSPQLVPVASDLLATT